MAVECLGVDVAGGDALRMLEHHLDMEPHQLAIPV